MLAEARKTAGMVLTTACVKSISSGVARSTTHSPVKVDMRSPCPANPGACLRRRSASFARSLLRPRPSLSAIQPRLSRRSRKRGAGVEVPAAFTSGTQPQNRPLRQLRQSPVQDSGLNQLSWAGEISPPSSPSGMRDAVMLSPQSRFHAIGRAGWLSGDWHGRSHWHAHDDEPAPQWCGFAAGRVCVATRYEYGTGRRQDIDTSKGRLLHS